MFGLYPVFVLFLHPAHLLYIARCTRRLAYSFLFFLFFKFLLFSGCLDYNGKRKDKIYKPFSLNFSHCRFVLGENVQHSIHILYAIAIARRWKMIHKKMYQINCCEYLSNDFEVKKSTCFDKMILRK